MIPGLFKVYDRFEITSDLSTQEVVQRIASKVHIDNKSRLAPPVIATNKKYYGFFYSPNRFVLKNNNLMADGMIGKNKTEIIVLEKNGTTQVRFRINNLGTKLLLMFMSFPFIGLFFYFIFDSKMDFNFFNGWPLLALPFMILLIGIIVIRFNLFAKKDFFQELLD